MSFVNFILNRYVGIFAFLEIINSLIFAYDWTIDVFTNSTFQFILGIVATFLAALLISNYFHNKQKDAAEQEKIKNRKKCENILFIVRKYRIQSSRILPSEEDFTDEYDDSLAKFQLSSMYFEKIQSIIYSNIDFLPPRSLSRILPVLSDFPLISSKMPANDILRARAHAELCISKLTDIISNTTFCDGN